MAWLLLLLILGIAPAALLLYWGFVSPATPTCEAAPMGSGQICDYTVYVIHYHFTYAQAVTFATLRQWVAGVTGIVWALVAVGFVVGRVRHRAFERAPETPLPAKLAAVEGGGAAYRRGQLLSLLRALGMVVCALGVLTLLAIPR